MVESTTGTLLKEVIKTSAFKVAVDVLKLLKDNYVDFVAIICILYRDCFRCLFRFVY